MVIICGCVLAILNSTTSSEKLDFSKKDEIARKSSNLVT